MTSAVEELAALTKALCDADYTAARRPCDIVMKGGITSGIVYPLAVSELAKTYTFCNVGGTSAGAIAAAAAAAAERGRGSGGFAALARLPLWLTENLISLFQPAPSTRSLFTVLMAATRPGKTSAKPSGLTRVARIAGAAARAELAAFIAGLLGTGLLAFGILLLVGSGLAAALVAAALLGIVGAIVTTALRYYRILTVDVPGNFNGICTGYAPPRDGAPVPLTTWLDTTLRDLAGVSGVLTFGALWGKDAVEADRLLTESSTVQDVADARRKRRVNLEMMTTSLSEGLPRRLPFDNQIFSFCPVDMGALFPPDVVTHLKVHGGETKDRDGNSVTCPTDPAHGSLFVLPPARDLPVVVATRMSLSFPVFLSAVRLYFVDFSRKAEKDKRHVECWFSDGGISSNFPVHFFDSLLPTRPTFGMNLTPYPLDYEDEDFYLPARTNDGGRPTYQPIPSFPAFAGAIKDTMQNWRDNSQSRLLGFRDRVVRVHLRKEEGGMNLQMPSDVIARVALRGHAAAAEKLVPFDFELHQWKRFRVSMSLVHQVLARMHRAYIGQDGAEPYESFLRRYALTAPSYRPTSGVWWQDADQALANLMATVSMWDEAPRRFTDIPPTVDAVLRLTPPA